MRKNVFVLYRFQTARCRAIYGNNRGNDCSAKAQRVSPPDRKLKQKRNFSIGKFALQPGKQPPCDQKDHRRENPFPKCDQPPVGPTW